MSGILGAVQCVVLFSKESVSNQIGLPRRSAYTDCCVVHNAFEPSAWMSLTPVCGAVNEDVAKVSTRRENDPQMGLMFI